MQAKLFHALVFAYFVSSLAHFVHNVEFIREYPNLPPWLTRADVYSAWAAITSVGVAGLLLITLYLLKVQLFGNQRRIADA